MPVIFDADGTLVRSPGIEGRTFLPCLLLTGSEPLFRVVLASAAARGPSFKKIEKAGDILSANSRVFIAEGALCSSLPESSGAFEERFALAHRTSTKSA
jgi:hypothetical protein